MDLCDDIRDLTERALWETENLLKAVPDELWEKRYDGVPMWKYLYHTLYSLDRWYINPDDPAYEDPDHHTATLADLNREDPSDYVDRETMERYYTRIRAKIVGYLYQLDDRELASCPPHCAHSRFKLILGQFRHWHRHMGIVYGFLIRDTGKWPYVLNMLGTYPAAPMPVYYDE